jgi:hypothetical protein
MRGEPAEVRSPLRLAPNLPYLEYDVDGRLRNRRHNCRNYRERADARRHRLTARQPLCL